jgi:hypothetical protein
MSVVATPTNSFLIPLSTDPQQFDIALGGINYQMTVKWNDQQDAGWVIDIADDSGTPIICNVPMITGDDLLSGLEYLGIPGSLYVYTNGSNPFDVPTLDNLGTDSNLYFVSEVTGG